MTLSEVTPKLTRTTCVDCGLPWPVEGVQPGDNLESRVNEVCQCVMKRESKWALNGELSRDTKILVPRFVVEDQEYNDWEDFKESCRDPVLVIPSLVCYAIVAIVIGFSIYYKE